MEKIIAKTQEENKDELVVKKKNRSKKAQANIIKVLNLATAGMLSTEIRHSRKSPNLPGTETPRVGTMTLWGAGGDTPVMKSPTLLPP